MLNRKIAKRYARALFSVCREAGETADLREQLRLAADIIQHDPDLAAALDHPLVGADEKKTHLRAAVAALAAPLVLDFLCLLIDRRRVGYLPAIYEELCGLVDESDGVVRAEVAAAAPLQPAEQAGIEKELARIFDARPLMTVSTNPDLIGGVIVRVHDTEIDGSLRTALDRLRRQFQHARPARLDAAANGDGASAG